LYPVHLGAFDVKLAFGVSLIVIVCVEVCVQFPSYTVSVTVFVPEVEYTTPAGFSEVEVAGVASCPKLQRYAQLPPVLPVLVKLIPVLAHCGAFDVKLAVGERLMLIVLTDVSVHPVVELVVTSVIILVPDVEYVIPVGS